MEKLESDPCFTMSLIETFVLCGQPLIEEALCAVFCHQGRNWRTINICFVSLIKTPFDLIHLKKKKSFLRKHWHVSLSV